MRVSRGVTVSLLACGVLAVPVVSFTILDDGEPASLSDVALDGVDPTVLDDAPQGLIVASDVHEAGEAPEVVPTDAAPAVLTAPIATEEFTAVGFSWDQAAADGVVVQARVREDAGWSEWFALPRTDEGPDAGTASAARQGERAGTDLLLTSGADGFQVRADAASGASVADLKAVLIDPGEPDGAEPVQIAGAAPGIIPRAQWGAGNTPTGDCAPTYSRELKAGVIHHTVSTNSYSAAQSAGMVRSIWLYHTTPRAQGGNGWCDIGYNFIVDRYGQVFEGAAGGVDENVIGAHAGGFNTSTFGVSTLGEFGAVAPPAAMTEAVAQTFAWKFGLAGIDPRSTTQLTSAGGGTAKYAAGTTVTLPVVMGHRDVGSTVCPGQLLYDQVGAVRTRVADLVEAQGRNLVRTAEDATVYVVSGSSKYTVLDMATLSALSPLGPVGFVSQQYLDRRTTVSVMSRIVLGPDGTVYFIDAGIRLPFTSCGQVADYGGSCGSLVRLEQSLIDAFHGGPPMTPIYRTTSGKAFHVSAGVKREVVDDAALVAAGLPTSSVTLLETGVARLPYGVPVVRDGVVLRNRSSKAMTVVGGGQFATVPEAVALTAFSSSPVRELDEASLRLLPAPASVPGAFVKEVGTSRVFLLTEAGKRLVVDAAMAPASVPVMPAGVLAVAPAAAQVEPGTFVKGSASGTVFALRGGQLRGISAWADLIALNGGNPAPRILSVDQRVADLIPGGPLQLGPGSLVVSPRSATVYFVNGPAELIPVSSFAVTGELGATRLVRVADADVDAYAVRPGVVTTAVECGGVRYLGLGGKLYKVGADAAAHYPALSYTAVDATTCAALPKAAGELTRFLRGGDGSIYYVADGVKRPISSYPAYLALGGTSANTIQTSAFALGLIPTGSTWSAAQQAAQQATPPATQPATPSAPAAGGSAAPTSTAAAPSPAVAGGDGTSTPAGATP